MAAVSLLFERTPVQIGGVTLDVSLSEMHTSANEVTDHPVETGVNIVDHVRAKPFVLRLEGMVSNTPLPSATATSTPRELRTKSGKVIQVASRSSASPKAAGTAYRELLRLRDDATLVTVVTGLARYDNMVVESLEVPRDAKTGQALRFSMSLKQIRQAVLQTAVIVPTALKSKGKVPTKTTSAEEESSLAFDIGEATGGTTYAKGALKAHTP